MDRRRLMHTVPTRATPPLMEDRHRILSASQHYLRAGVVDQLRLHIVPILLGDGTRLFVGPEERAIELAASGSVDAHGVTHLVCRAQVNRGSRA